MKKSSRQHYNPPSLEIFNDNKENISEDMDSSENFSVAPGNSLQFAKILNLLADKICNEIEGRLSRVESRLDDLEKKMEEKGIFSKRLEY